MQINKSFRSQSGKDVTANLTVENFKVSGTATINGVDYAVTNFAVVQGKKVLSIKGAIAPYLQIPNDLYDSINSACKSQFAAQMTPLEIAEGKMREAENNYKKIFNNSGNPIEIINARNAWDSASDEYNKLAKGK